MIGFPWTIFSLAEAGSRLFGIFFADPLKAWSSAAIAGIDWTLFL